MCLTNIHMKEFFLCVIFVVEISKKLEKIIFVKKKWNSRIRSKTLCNIEDLQVHNRVKNFRLIPSGLADIASLELVNSSILVLYLIRHQT